MHIYMVHTLIQTWIHTYIHTTMHGLAVTFQLHMTNTIRILDSIEGTHLHDVTQTVTFFTTTRFRKSFYFSNFLLKYFIHQIQSIHSYTTDVSKIISYAQLHFQTWNSSAFLMHCSLQLGLTGFSDLDFTSRVDCFQKSQCY